MAEEDFEQQKGNFISSPTLGKPAFWLRNSKENPFVVIDFSGRDSALPTKDPDTWKVVLIKSNGNDAFEIDTIVERTEKAGCEHFLYISIPEEIPVDLFDVKVSAYIGQNVYSSSQPNAVKIINETKDHYFIIHVTDIHVDDGRGYAVNYAETTGYGVIKKMIHMVNLLDPELVIITGDNVFGLRYTREYPHLYNILQEFDVPIFMSIGNHDAINHDFSTASEKMDGLKVFEEFFAPANFSFRYGALKYISLNSMDWGPFNRRGKSIITLAPGGQMRTEQLDWFEDETTETDAELIVVGYHHPPQNSFQGEGAERVMATARKYNVDAVLTGHTHRDEALFEKGVLYLTTTSLLFNGFYGSYPAIRILEVSENKLISWNYEEPPWSVPVYKDSSPYSPVWNLRDPALFCSYEPSNDGCSTTVTATLANYLTKDYNGISLEFLMPTPEQGKSYIVSGGEVVDMYDTGVYQTWYVKTSVESEAYTEVTITPAHGFMRMK